MVALSAEEGLELFDAALRCRRGRWCSPLRSGSPRLLRAQARAGMLPPLLRGLIRVPRTPGAERAAARWPAAGRACPRAEREALVLELVRAHDGRRAGSRVRRGDRAQRPFKELGFDSLRRWSCATG